MRKLIFSLIFLSAMFAIGCQKDDPNAKMQPDMAKSMVKLKGYEADEKGLFQAVKNNDVMILKAFVDAGVNPNAQNDMGETLLTFSIPTIDTKTVKAVMDISDINLRDKNGSSPIHLSLLKNKDEILDALLEKGADVNVPGRDKATEDQTVLYLAVIRSREDLIKTLLERGANPNQPDKSGAVPLSEACLGATVKPTIVQMLLDKGANPNLKENKGGSPLLFLASNDQISSGKRQEVVKMLLDKGADKNIKDSKGKTPYDWAKQVGNTDILDLLK